MRRRIWVALALALTGLGLIVNVAGGGSSLSTAGLAFALGGAFAYALYVLLAEHVVGGRDPVSLLAWGFLFASLFWAIVVPWWSFSAGSLTKDTSLGGHLAAHHLPVWVLARLDGRARHDRAVLPADQRAPPPSRDNRRRSWR